MVDYVSISLKTKISQDFLDIFLKKIMISIITIVLTIQYLDDWWFNFKYLYNKDYLSDLVSWPSIMHFIRELLLNVSEEKH